MWTSKQQKRQSHSIREHLFHPISKQTYSSNRKVTIVGAGKVGMATAFSLLTQSITKEVCLFDIKKDHLIGELLDLLHGSIFLNEAKVSAAIDYDMTANSSICIVTASDEVKPNDTADTLMERNVNLLADVVPQLAKYSPRSVIIMVTDPVDILTYMAWKLSGFPKERVIGTGTYLDSARFQLFIAQRLGVAPSSCDGWIIGEHGDTSVPVWSSVRVGGVLLSDLNPNIGTIGDPENWTEVHEKIVNAEAEVIQKKGYSNWAIGLTTASLTAQILNNSNKIVPVSTLVRGQQNLHRYVFLSLPCVVGANGISSIVKLPLSTTENEMLHKSAMVVAKNQEVAVNSLKDVAAKYRDQLLLPRASQ